MSDLRYALRQLRRSPGFTVVALLTLTIAIGINTTIFALVHAAVLKPLVETRPEEVVSLFTARQDAAKDYRQFSFREFEALRAERETLQDVAASQFALAGVGQGDRVRRSFAFLVSDNLLPLLGARPAIGRFFTPEETNPGADLPVVVTSWQAWQRHGGRPDFVGSTLTINGRPFTVIGVTHRGFTGVTALLTPEVWLPLGVATTFATPFTDGLAPRDLRDPRNYTLNLTARLAPGLSLEGGRARAAVLAARLTEVNAGEPGGARSLELHSPSRFSISTQPSDDGPIGLIGLLLVAMAAVVLLIACLNLANLMLARGAARSREIAIRLSLGAQRWRVVRQLVVEGLVLALAGGALGLLVSWWANDLLLQSMTALFATMNFSPVLDLSPKGPVLAATAGFCLLATVVFSLGPAVRATGRDVAHDLKDQGADSVGAGRLNRFFAPRNLLVMAQIALSLMLLFSAGLFLRGALAAGSIRPGFESAGALVAEVDFSLTTAAAEEARSAALGAWEAAAALPGVRHAALATLVPYGNIINSRRVVPAEAAPPDQAPGAPAAGFNGLITAVTPGYFATMGVPLLRGRDFTEAEARDPKGRGVAIIDERMAQSLFPDGDALGRSIRYTQANADGTQPELEIIGIAASFRHEVLSPQPPRRLFVPFAQSFSGNAYVHVRLEQTGREAVLARLGDLREALARRTPDLPLVQLTPLTGLMERHMGLWLVRIAAILFGLFGGVALVLATIGVYGVKAYAVVRRTREIGIRMALGARPGDVFRLIMRQGLQQTLAAVAVGCLLALALGQALAGMLYQVSPRDPLVLAAVAALLAAATLLACYLPSRRATRVDPLVVLRDE